MTTLIISISALGVAGTSQGITCEQAFKLGSYEQALPLCEQKAESNSLAARQIGIMYRDGLGVVPDAVKALDYFKQAADLGDPQSQLFYSEMAFSDPSLGIPLFEATDRLRVAANADLSKAQWLLSVCHWLGIGVSPQRDLAIYWYDKAHTLNGTYPIIAVWPDVPKFYQGKAQFGVDDFARSQEAQKLGQTDAANEWLHQAAEEGHLTAQLMLGERYLFGITLPQDENKAFTWFSRASQQKHPVARAYLAWCYAHGLGVATDFSRAVSIFADALTLPIVKESQRSLPSDQGSETLETKAAKGDAAAQLTLAKTYLKGQSSSELSQARKWLNQLAISGNAEAMAWLGKIYLDGLGVIPSPAKGLRWLEQSASNGYVPGQYWLANEYYRGDVIAKDPVNAYAWATLAYSGGANEAYPLLQLLNSEMSIMERQAAESLISNLENQLSGQHTQSN